MPAAPGDHEATDTRVPVNPHMGNRKLTIAMPVLIITLGTGSLLTQHKVLPDVNWLWVLGLAMVGILAFVLGGSTRRQWWSDRSCSSPLSFISYVGMN